MVENDEKVKQYLRDASDEELREIVDFHMHHVKLVLTELCERAKKHGRHNP